MSATTTPPSRGTVPVAPAALLLSAHAGLGAAILPCIVTVGSRPEVDLDLLACTLRETHPELPHVPDVLADYWQACTDHWAAGPGPDSVLTRHRIAEHAQVTAKVGRRYLDDVYVALAELPTMADLMRALTSAVSAPDELRSAAEKLAGRAAVELLGGGKHSSSATAFPPFRMWPDVVGGAPWPGEVQREVQLRARHSPSVDRRGRRLTGVTVFAHVLLPDPTRWQDKLHSH